MKIAFCDDNEKITEALRAHAYAWAEQNNVDIECTVFRSSEEFLLAWNSPALFDVIFLDIKMDKISGIELARIIRKIDADVLLAFITGLTDYALEGFDVEVFHYLVKPVTKTQFFECLDRALKRRADDPSKTFLIETADRTLKFSHNELLYFESRSHHVEAHTTKGHLEFRARLSDLEKELTPEDGFLKIHRSYLVNVRHIRGIGKSEAIMENGALLPISRYRINEIYNAFVMHHKAG